MPQRIAISGSSGLIGSSLIQSLQKSGFSISRLMRSSEKTAADPNIINWNIEQGYVDAQRLEEHYAVIHLAGANVADQRWTPAFKKIIRDSRIHSTRLLSVQLANLKNPPRTFFCASAVGYYGNHKPENIIDESASMGEDFLASVCDEWEHATKPAEDAGIRVVHLRIGAVLSRNGGALAKMLPIFNLGLGGKLDSGNQIMSWIVLEEIPMIVVHLFDHDNISGAVNVVSPQAVTNKEFTKTFGKVIGRPTVFPVPGFGVRLLFGEMADAFLIGGANVFPKRLLESGYQFKYPDLKSALEHSLLANA